MNHRAMNPRTTPAAAAPRPLPRLPRQSAWIPTLLALALAAVCLAPSLAQAKCMAGNITAWPPPDTALPAQPLILFEGFGNDQAQVSALGEGGSAHLVAAGHRVKLVVGAINIGAFGLTQAVLTAAEPLKPATHYTLEVRSADGEKTRTTHFVQGEPRPIGWTTAAADAETAPLALSSSPIVTGQSYRRLGCGPSSRVEVSLPATSGAPIAVEVKLREIGVDGPPATYIVPIRDGVLRLGHGMCSGAFRLTGGERRFQAELTVRDAAGDAIAAPQTLAFDGVDPMGAFRRIKLR